ncbi:MAG: tRNA pseudouridine(38-40) synthase TruA [Methylobacter sp.]|nr:MAG: tRNA pseudouridine(38-40) synthase TruA [Methylobacter sp.]
MPRIVLGIEYHGGRFCGWQWQPGLRSVQSVLELALAKIADEPVNVICAGRTDAGVHASEQVVHFDTLAERAMHAWVLGGNSQLPDDVRILWAKPAVEDFHARYSAIARWYRYLIFNRPVSSALLHRQATWCYLHLDHEAMNQAAQSLVGNHDFSSFRAQGCQSKSPWRVLHFIEVQRQGEQVIIDVAANAFLHHMVRNIVGALLEIGQGKQPIGWTGELLAVKNRGLAGITAAPDGLYLAGVCYPEKYGLARQPAFAKLPKDAKRFEPA